MLRHADITIKTWAPSLTCNGVASLDLRDQCWPTGARIDPHIPVRAADRNGTSRRPLRWNFSKLGLMDCLPVQIDHLQRTRPMQAKMICMAKIRAEAYKSNAWRMICMASMWWNHQKADLTRFFKKIVAGTTLVAEASAEPLAACNVRGTTYMCGTACIDETWGVVRSDELHGQHTGRGCRSSYVANRTKH